MVVNEIVGVVCWVVCDCVVGFGVGCVGDDLGLCV